MRAPASTYRLQITAGFDLYAAARLLPYLHDLGVDWVYLSPLLQAEPGSDHGYDVIAHDVVDADRGGEEGLAALSAEARRLGMGVLADIVPNHVGVATPVANHWWWQLLRGGPESPRAAYFDVDWDAGEGRVLIPVVGDDDVLDDGRIGHLSVVDADGQTELRYHDHRFPVAVGTGGPGDDPDEVHARQHYRLMSWRRADDRLNYRRFFAVNSLAAVRVEDRHVFSDAHVEVRRWFDEGLVDGLRVDHPDGLRDPRGYLVDLARLTGSAYTLVEKILEPGEELEPSWATDGTTGYDALAWIERVLVDPDGERPLDLLEERLRGAPVDWHRLVHDRKREVADGMLGSEVRRVVRETGVRAGQEPPALVDAVAELMACFPVYRSYLPEGRQHLDRALELARSHRPDLATAYDELAPVLGDPEHPAAIRFQQTSGMVMAKGVEDCAFYRWSRLTSLNEVGGDPSVFAADPGDFHAWAAARQHHHPRAMTALSTHDTKRGEDTRARITALAEIPGEWEIALDRLLRRTPTPDPGFAALLWQAVVGVWGSSEPETLRARLHAYAEKAMREAGEHTTYTEPDEEFERRVHQAVDAAFDSREVRETVEELVERVSLPGLSNGLAAKLLALTLPGVPDVYQGSERAEQSLVDPDNRRPVDHEASARLLAHPDPHDPGSVKLSLTAAALRLRRDRPELFNSYAPLVAEGPAAGHVLAFDRGGAVSVVTRLPLGLAARGGWGETVLRLPTGRWADALSPGGPWSGTVRVADLLGRLPVALLTEEA